MWSKDFAGGGYDVIQSSDVVYVIAVHNCQANPINDIASGN